MEYKNILDRATIDGTLDVNMLKNEAHKQKFKFKYENGNTERIIFYIEYKPTLLNNKMFCNGLIFEYIDINNVDHSSLCENKNIDVNVIENNVNVIGSNNSENVNVIENNVFLNQKEWTLVCLPMPVFEQRTKDTVITDEYYIYPIKDATIVNVYFSRYLNKWCFGTKRSFNIYDQSWRGVPYSEILKPIEAELYSMDLDMTMTYVYSITDPRIHLFSKTAVCEQIAKFDVKNMLIEINAECLDIPVSTAMNNVAGTYKNYLNTGDVNLGYIFRNGHHSYIVESDLLRSIKKILYAPTIERGLSGKRNKELLQYTNDIDYIIVRAYFMYFDAAQKLFPSFVPYFESIRGRMSELIMYLKARVFHETPDGLEEYETFYSSNMGNLSNLRRQRTGESLFVKIRKYVFYNNKIIETFFSIIKKHGF